MKKKKQTAEEFVKERHPEAHCRHPFGSWYRIAQSATGLLRFNIIGDGTSEARAWVNARRNIKREEELKVKP